MQEILNFIALDTKMLAIHGLSMFVTAILFLFAGRILSVWREDPAPGLQIMALRLFLLMYFSFEFIDIILLHALPKYDRPLYSGALSILTFCIGVLINNLLNRAATRRFGAERKIDGREETIPTYYSRLTSLIFSVIISMVVIYLLVKIWEMNSLLETTGFVGLIAAFLVFTNAIWLPDVYYGLVILNSDMFQDGDAIRFENGGGIYVINRVSLIYTSLLNVESNNKAVLRNSKIFEHKVENLTRRASIEGLRQDLYFKVSYPKFQLGDQTSTDNGQNLSVQVDRFYQKLDSMFKNAISETKDRCQDCMAQNAEFDWGILNAGDYALEIVLHYYLAPLPSTKLTKNLRKIIFATRQKILYAVYKQSIIYGVELSTPTLINIDTLTKAPQRNKPEMQADLFKTVLEGNQ